MIFLIEFILKAIYETHATYDAALIELRLLEQLHYLAKDRPFNSNISLNLLLCHKYLASFIHRLASPASNAWAAVSHYPCSLILFSCVFILRECSNT